MNAYLRPKRSAKGPQNKLPTKTPTKTILAMSAISLSAKSQSAPAHVEMKDNKVTSIASAIKLIPQTTNKR
jgi:hypothetical protein